MVCQNRKIYDGPGTGSSYFPSNSRAFIIITNNSIIIIIINTNTNTISGIIIIFIIFVIITIIIMRANKPVVSTFTANDELRVCVLTFEG